MAIPSMPAPPATCFLPVLLLQFCPFGSRTSMGEQGVRGQASGPPQPCGLPCTPPGHVPPSPTKQTILGRGKEQLSSGFSPKSRAKARAESPPAPDRYLNPRKGFFSPILLRGEGGTLILDLSKYGLHRLWPALCKSVAAHVNPSCPYNVWIHVLYFVETWSSVYSARKRLMNNILDTVLHIFSSLDAMQTLQVVYF